VSLSRRRPLARSIRALADGFSLDLSLAMTGGCLAVLWEASPPLVLLAVGPMALAYRSLLVPLLEHKSRTDPKTGLYNSEHFETELADALRAVRKGGGELSVAIFDLDHLRAVNNRFGHLAADQLIRGVAGLLTSLSPEHAVVARFGGEEFCLLMPGVGRNQAREAVERIRAAVQVMRLDGDLEQELAITVSAGVATFPESGETADALMTSADAALYDAKLAGRNRVRVAFPTDSKLRVGLASATSTGSRPSPAAAPHTAHDDAIPASGPGDTLSESTQEASADQSRPPRAAWSLVAGLVLAAVVVAATTLPGGVRGSSLAFVFLILSVVALDTVRIDVFERGKISPASVATLALAFLSGPVGPIAAEASIAALRAVRRERLIRLAFDFGALSLAGTAAALVYRVADTGLALPLLGAAAGGFAYYAVNIPLLSIIVSLNAREPVVNVWKEQFAWLWPHFVAFGVLAGTFALTEHRLGLYAFVIFGVPLLVLWTAEAQYLKRSRASVTELRRANKELESANLDLRKLLESNEQLFARVHRSYLATITSLARTIDAKDPYTGGHTERVAEFSRLIAIELGFDEEQLRAVEVGAVIHDIGKIGVPDQILLKEGRLDEAEFAEMRRHPEISSYIIGELDLPAIVKQMVRSHHERYDGSGYPDGLIGEEIPLASRILSVADALDAMTSDRPYRPAMSLEAARAELDANTDVQFCPRVVAALRRCMERDPGLWKGLCAGVEAGRDPRTEPQVAHAG
jgi:diguanylate cyclase (GGDEF)-like protein